MRSFRVLLILGIFSILVSFRAQSSYAQDNSSGPSAPDNVSEISKLKESCSSFALKSIFDCAGLLFTGDPVHIALGSLAPQNGFGAGLAYVGFLKPSETWRPSWDADAIATLNGSWRAGAYLRLVHTPDFRTTVHYGPPQIKSNLTEIPEHMVLGVYAEAESLNKLPFFGLGPNTSESARSYFGMREIIVGSNVVEPISEIRSLSHMNLSLLGELNGRFVSIRPSLGNSSPTIGSLYDETTAPGLSSQPGFFQLGEAVRIRPVLLNDLLHLNYQASYRQFFAPSDTRFTFQTFTIDLSNEIAIYRLTTRFYVPRDVNGPDECSIDRVGDFPACSLNKADQVGNCDKISGKNSAPCKAISRDLQGSIGIRFLYTASFTQNQNLVPFYFQPTIGGGDLNGSQSLSSYQDYRFRAPNVLLLQEKFEHSIWRWPVGFALLADQGKVALTDSGLDSSRWFRSFATGLTLRAGGFPQVWLLFAWGGHEGTHTIAQMNTSLLGGSARPSLF